MAKWRFEKEGKPLLQANESPASFKKRVKAWEKRTGREYVPMEFGAEEKILSGKTLIGGWGNQTDYFNNDSFVNEQNIKASKGKDSTYARSIERDKEMDRMKASGETEYDQTSIQYAINEYNKRQEEEKSQLEDWQEEAGYPGVQGGDADYGQWRGDDGEQANAENRAVVKKKVDKMIAEEKNAQYLKSVSWDGMNRTYTSDYREAVKNAAGWSAYYDETDEAGNPIAKSDVFTRGEDGLPLGVMTRSQRRAYDMKMHEAKMATKAQMEDSGRSESDVKAINSKEGLETVIDGGESAKTDVAEKSQANIIKPPEREEIKLPGGR